MESCWKNPKRKPWRAQLGFLLSLSKWRTSTLKVTFWNVQKKGYSQATRLLTLKKKVLQICKTPGKEREKNTLIKCHINKKPVHPQASQETHTWWYIMGTKDGSCSELVPHYWLQNKNKSKGEMGGSPLMKKDGRERNLNLRNRTGHTGVSGQMGSVKRTELTANHHKLWKLESLTEAPVSFLLEQKLMHVPWSAAPTPAPAPWNHLYKHMAVHTHRGPRTGGTPALHTL